MKELILILATVMMLAPLAMLSGASTHAMSIGNAGNIIWIITSIVGLGIFIYGDKKWTSLNTELK